MSDEVSLFDLFREEVREHAATLSAGLIALEAGAGDPRKIEPLMRAAHSIKGAARIVNIEPAVGLAHVMEDALVAAQHGKIAITPADIDALLEGTDLLADLAELSEATAHEWGPANQVELDRLSVGFRALASGAPAPQATPTAPAKRARPVMPDIPREPIAAGDEDPMFDLFREELRGAALVIRDSIEVGHPSTLAAAAQAARAIRGAARIARLEAGALAAALEDALAHADKHGLALTPEDRDTLTDAVALLAGLLGHTPETAPEWAAAHEKDIADLKTLLVAFLSRQPPAAGAVTPGRATPEVVLVPAQKPAARMPAGPLVAEAAPVIEVVPVKGDDPVPAADAEAVVRVTAGSLNRLMGLAGESLVQARWLQPFSTALLKLRRHQDQLSGVIDALAQAAAAGRHDQLGPLLDDAIRQASACRRVLAERMGEFDEHAAQAEDLNTRLYREVIVSRMRPFGDGAHGFPRLVRDMARKLDRQVRLEIDGLGTEVDRDILEKLEAPLTHLLRNAVDHGIEPPEDRLAAGKPEQALLRLEVRHRAGMLAVSVSDDGRGIDLERLRRRIVEKGMTSTDLVSSMTESELLEFLFLPGFSTARDVTEYSGRGVGLDVVLDTLRRVGGSVRVSTKPGRGTSFHLSLPITLSVLRAVLVDIAGEPYAFPHNRIDRLIRVPRSEVRSLEHRQFVRVDGQNVGLVVAAQLLDLPPAVPPGDELPVLLLGDDSGQYGLIVEAFRGEQDLVVRPLDPRLGKVPNMSAASLLDDGSPVLIADVEDLIRSMDQFIQTRSLTRCDDGRPREQRRKRVLVVDDSITVREVERQLLKNEGYEVAVAVDGVDGWNQARAGSFDLIVSDVDMPRMTGLELIKSIRSDDRLRDVPIIIVSYKDREDDRLRGLDLGANYYLTKSSFHDDSFLRAVADLIGEA